MTHQVKDYTHNGNVAKSQIHLLIVDDQKFVCEFLQAAFETEPDFHISGVAANAKTALSLIASLEPDIALIDVEMPDMDGLTMTQIIRDRHAHTKVLVLSSHEDVSYIQQALEAGANGYLLKGTPHEELVHALRFIHRGYLQLGPGLFEKLGLNLSGVNPVFSPESIKSSIFAPSTIHPPIPESPLTIAEDDWSASTQDAVNTFPKVWARSVIYLFLGFVALILPWSVLMKIDEIGVAPGRLEPKGQSIRLDAPVQAKVVSVDVVPGQQVRQGQQLMTLQADTVNSDLQQEELKLVAQQSKRIELTGIKTQIQMSLSAERSQFESQGTSQMAEIDKVRYRQSGLQRSITLVETLLSQDRNTIRKLRALQAEGAIPQTQVEQAERTMIQNQQQLQQFHSDLEQAKGELQKQQSEYQRIRKAAELAAIEKNKQIKEIQSQIVEIQANIAQGQQRIQSLQTQKQQHFLYASTSGIIDQLAVQHPGAVVQPGQLLAQLAPTGAKLVLRSQIQTRDSGFLKVGLPVKLKFDAYPFQDYGIATGKLSWIAPMSEVISTASSPEAKTQSTSQSLATKSFAIEVTLDKSVLHSGNQVIALKAGQTATAEVIIRQRRLIDLLLEPFQKLARNNSPL
jgi:hemolysin D